MSINTLQLISERIDSLKTRKDVTDLPWRIFYDTDGKCDERCKTLLRVAILSNPCNGFGDIVFAIKLKNYIKEWYGCVVNIITTQPSGFQQLGEPVENIYLLKGGTKKTQCLSFKRLSAYTPDGNPITLPVYDLLFVAPLTVDFDVDYSDIRPLFPYCNPLNTFIFSEYNDSKYKPVDFHTGIGQGRSGLFMTNIKRDSKLAFMNHPYSVIYVSTNIARTSSCILSFMEMVCKKYSKKYLKFDITIPVAVADNILERKYVFIRKLSRYFDTIIIKRKDSIVILFGENHYNDTVLTLRADIFPLKNNDMMRLMTHSVRDILLTGDQSITDAISCCAGKKNIFYQIAQWKENLGKNLAKYLPNRYLSSKKTSCGGLSAIRYKSNYSKFKRDWDFRRLGRKKLDAIFLSAIHRKSNKAIQRVEDAILSSRTVSGFVKRMGNILYSGN